MVELTPVTLNEKEILNDLLEKYQYEFSQWDKRDVDEKGLFGYEYLDCYFTEENRFPCYTLVEGYPNREVNYDDGTPADVFFFEN